MIHNNDVRNTEDNGNKPRTDGDRDVTVPNEKFLFREIEMSIILKTGFIVLGLICLGSTWAWPESPYWLANKGNLEQSRAAFMWLRGKGGREELASVLKARRRPGPPKLFWISLLITVATILVSTFSYLQLVLSSMAYHELTALLYYFFAPETKDKTLLEIQRSYTPDENDSNPEQNQSIMLNVI
ncbi:hypothetical protein MSG28_012648 [Choristoneura fumiferana]|uniref:Uncharacterized protein n=1 Tax=Choristoneura fumiferana TaxID=7141 RepID=A0ACC0JHM8_CHOFU|nr:hypothetical protein MSG28_012648 [Choristoneura fumiferana]